MELKKPSGILSLIIFGIICLIFLVVFILIKYYQVLEIKQSLHMKPQMCEWHTNIFRTSGVKTS